MPALLVDTNPRPASPSDASTSSDRSPKHSDSASPDRPPVSPITPTVSVAQLAPVEPTAARPRVVAPPTATFRQQPPSVPISESENPDAIALRSAISLLQLQREKSKRDLKALEELKAAAVSDPQAFARSLQEQRAQASQSYHDILTPTLSGLVDPAQDHEQDIKAEQPSTDERKDSAATGAKLGPAKIPAIPQPQNVVRCPPVNWAKYHIVGEPLDKLHEEQKKWPGAAEPPRAKSGMRAPPHTVTAPYSPFTDGLGQSPSASQPPKSFKKSPS
ncbi:uncharacterized protein K460DRAFT_289308 [Cucurbitaria berberidis CBS 394.84]|uniref:Uncharacterized protein n=1 Tax=Cucurbitaria berberidis CBS 394.84 TaxID=1168544 RepID=A0A9P4GBQ9_9PLEO|nr:uncharacterized protein K460DRAFT_289308 [Cucurbitaria berberidis CBS 394.84]KAF1842687.1 hypothetical protein K460DRAFT_289308 [Cucurbitaria berberidis CBS 394.84]